MLSLANMGFGSQITINRTTIRRAMDKVFFVTLTLMLITSPVMVMAALRLITHSERPVVVIMNNDMAPALKLGDLIFAARPSREYHVGEIVIFFPNSGDGACNVERVHQVHHKLVPPHPHSPSAVGDVGYVTKGDSTPLLDPPRFLSQGEIRGRVYATIPKLGYGSIVVQKSDWVIAIVMLTLLLGIIGGDAEQEEEGWGSDLDEEEREARREAARRRRDRMIGFTLF